MKHAFLIIAHNEFDILSILVDLLDDSRNDVFIHIDKKVNDLPTIKTKYSNVFFVDNSNRVDVRWGDISQIEAEFALFELANQKGPYAYYHMISGVHLPLVKQDAFHEYFSTIPVSQVFVPMTSSPEELERKGNRMNLFMKSFNNSLMSQRLWRVGIKVQDLLGIYVNKDRTFIKASNWVSITDDAVKFLLSKKKEILIKYKYTMCGDELFLPTELVYSGKNWNIIYSDKLLMHIMGNANAQVFTDEDFTTLMESNCLFARKFSSKHFGIVEKILDKIKS